jgi:hypothetical protein
VIIGSARDIVEENAVPRFVFTNLPLGNPVGPADDPDQQRGVLRLALALAESATHAQTTVQAPVVWHGRPDWQDTFMDTSDAQALAQEGEQRRTDQAAAKTATPADTA